MTPAFLSVWLDLHRNAEEVPLTPGITIYINIASRITPVILSIWLVLQWNAKEVLLVNIYIKDNLLNNSSIPFECLYFLGDIPKYSFPKKLLYYD